MKDAFGSLKLHGTYYSRYEVQDLRLVGYMFEAPRSGHHKSTLFAGISHQSTDTLQTQLQSHLPNLITLNTTMVSFTTLFQFIAPALLVTSLPAGEDKPHLQTIHLFLTHG
jgi:hypothetical protein